MWILCHFGGLAEPRIYTVQFSIAAQSLCTVSHHGRIEHVQWQTQRYNLSVAYIRSKILKDYFQRSENKTNRVLDWTYNTHQEDNRMTS